MITDEDKERVRQATDIVALVGETVVLKQRGQEFWGCCPFHHEKSPSFKVNPQTGLWHCFGCGQGGDVFSYVQKRENLEFPDAIRYLADRAGIELTEERNVQHGPKRSRLLACLAEAERFYHMMLMRGKAEGPAAARSYFAGRGFGSAVCRAWDLGYAPGYGTLVDDLRKAGFTKAEMLACDLARERSGRLSDRFFDRVMFPIHDEQGRTIAFGGRILAPKKHDGIAKYINTGDTPVFNKRKHLFALDKAKDTMVATGTAIVCEGYTDVIALHEGGFTNAVAALGTAFSLDHVKTLERLRVKRIVCMFDGDAAGQRAAERAIQYVDKTTSDLLCVVLPDNQDPMEFLASHPKEEMQKQLDQAEPLIDFVFRKRLEGYDLSIPGVRVKALDDLAGLLAPLKSSPLLDSYATQLADALGMDKDETKRLIRQKPLPKDQEAEPRRSRPQAGSGLAKKPQQTTVPTYDGPSYDDFDYQEEEPYPDVPPEAYEDAGEPSGPAVPSAALSADERRQIDAERELLALMADYPKEARPYAQRIATFAWADSRHEAMAWAMLATPEEATPAEVVAAATSVYPGAAQILGGGSIASTEGMSAAQKMSFLVDTAELYSTKRKVREIRTKLRNVPDPLADSTKELFIQATELQKRVHELSARLSASAEAN